MITEEASLSFHDLFISCIRPEAVKGLRWKGGDPSFKQDPNGLREFFLIRFLRNRFSVKGPYRFFRFIRSFMI